MTAVTGDCLFLGGLGRTTKPADFKSHAARTKDRVGGANLGRGLPPTAVGCWDLPPVRLNAKKSGYRPKVVVRERF